MAFGDTPARRVPVSARPPQPVLRSPAATPPSIDSWTSRSRSARAGISGSAARGAVPATAPAARRASPRTGRARLDRALEDWASPSSRWSRPVPGAASRTVRSCSASIRSPDPAGGRGRGPAPRTSGRRRCRPGQDISALSRTLAKNGQLRYRRPSSRHRLAVARRTHRAPSPSPYQPGRSIRACDQAKTHGIARRSAIDGSGRRGARDAPRRGRPRAAGRDPSRRVASSSIGVTTRKNATKPGRPRPATDRPRCDVAASSSMAARPLVRGGAATRRSCSGVRGQQHGGGRAARGGAGRSPGRRSSPAITSPCSVSLQAAVDRARRRGRGSPGSPARRPARSPRPGRGTASARRRARRAVSASASCARWSSQLAAR